MTVCPFCKVPVHNAHAPCPQCGKLATEHPSVNAVAGRNIGDDFDDDLDTGGLDLEQGSAVGGSASGRGAGAAAGGHGSYDGGMSLDDDFDDDGPRSGDLELDIPGGGRPSGAMPAAHTSGSMPAVRMSGAPQSNPSLPVRAGAPLSASRPSGPVPGAPQSGPHVSAPPRSGPGSGAGTEASLEPSADDAPPAPPPRPKAPPPPDPAALMVAKYPPVPTKLWQAPIYACKVLWRQFELRQNLESLRRKRSPDVPLYERALAAHDKKLFAVGLAITCAALTVATFVFFLPVILRFLHTPD